MYCLWTNHHKICQCEQSATPIMKDGKGVCYCIDCEKECDECFMMLMTKERNNENENAKTSN